MSNYDRLSIKLGLTPKVEKAKKPIKQRSEKRVKEQKEYVKIVKEMLTENPNCDIKEDGCQTVATGLHHLRKRSPATWLDKRWLKRACDNCNSWVELHPLEAIEKGHSISKHLPILVTVIDPELKAIILEEI